jgi:hypothetical protein
MIRVKMWQKNVSFGYAQLMGGGSERATLKSLPVRGAVMRSSPTPGLGGADQFPGLPEAQILTRWTFYFLWG